MGYGWLSPEHAGLVNDFYREWLNPYRNFHRPCGFATTITAADGGRRKVYKVYQTPLESLKSLSRGKRKLNKGVTLESLDRTARTMSDTEFAAKMQEAKRTLFRLCESAGLGRPAPVERAVPEAGARP